MLSAEHRVAVPGWDSSRSCILLWAPSWAGQGWGSLLQVEHLGKWGCGEPLASATGLGDSYPAGSWCEWDQSQSRLRASWETKPVPAALVPSGLAGGYTLVPWGDLLEQSLLQSLPILCLWHCSLKLASMGTQPWLGLGAVWAGEGREALRLGWCRVGWGTACQLNCGSGSWLQTGSGGCWRVEQCDREAIEPGKMGVSQGRGRWQGVDRSGQ